MTVLQFVYPLVRHLGYLQFLLLGIKRLRTLLVAISISLWHILRKITAYMHFWFFKILPNFSPKWLHAFIFHLTMFESCPFPFFLPLWSKQIRPTSPHGKTKTKSGATWPNQLLPLQGPLREKHANNRSLAVVVSVHEFPGCKPSSVGGWVRVVESQSQERATDIRWEFKFPWITG